ncbi:MAG: cadherin-like beta sandwich domain-containing protein [Deltaproteobacteria bacterium]|nr:cadherin-like beta sandwich domain-containing protein [Deltaproteobacteria bacterium]
MDLHSSGLARRLVPAAVLGLITLGACALDREGTLPAGSYTLGGTVSGLNGDLTLFCAGSAVQLTENGPFQFPNRVSNGASYEVLVVGQPEGQRCTVSLGAGVVAGADVHVTVGCQTQAPFTVGGEVTGLSGAVTLWNGFDTLVVDQDGPFAFPTALADETPYTVQVILQPDDQLCEVTDGAGTIAGANVTDVWVACLSDNARLSDLTLGQGALEPSFSPTTTIYQVDLGLWTQGLTLAPTTADPAAAVTVAGALVPSGESSLPVALDLGSNVITITVTAESGTTRGYTVFASRAENVAFDYLKASNAEPSDTFGFSVALSGDTLVVGAPFEDSSTTGVGGMETDNGAHDAGAVYVFTRGGDTWTQQAYIKASTTGTNDHFGTSVAIDGDTLVVGAPLEDSNATGMNGTEGDNSATDAGAVYVFTRSGTAWAQEAYLKAANTGNYDHFGTSVAIDGDTLVVGAPYEDSGSAGVGADDTDDSATNAGATYVFTRTGTTWSQQVYLKASDPDGDDYFGFSVAAEGDLVAVGAYLEDGNATGINGDHFDNSATDSGAAYVFERAGTTWSQQIYAKASNTDPDDYLGVAVALTGNTLVVGAYGEDSSATGVNGDHSDNSLAASGAAYVFERVNNTWSQQAYLKASNVDGSDYFGRYLDAWGETIVVGAAWEDSSGTGLQGNPFDNGANQSGAVYLFNRGAGSWAHATYLKPYDTFTNDFFGSSVALSADALAVASPYENSSATGVNGDPFATGSNDSGAVYLIQ